MSRDEGWMQEALVLAKRAADRGEVPVGAVVVRDETIVGVGYNLRESAQDPTAHAELIAVRAAAARLGSWRLDECEVFVTLEPCPMCAGMLVAARVPRVVYGALDPKAGATESLFRLGDDARLNHRFESVSGVLEHECSAVLTEFFAAIRASRKTGSKAR
ncbi:MAG: tRNA(adenine34) deaminase [Polyangiales bacterium]|jgi:tRNA(adenine34) deaminase